MIKKITKSQLKEYARLKQKKYRDDLELFIVEGEKIVSELLVSEIKINAIVGSKLWIEKNNSLIKNIESFEAGTEDLERISSFKSPNNVIAVAEKPHRKLNITNLQNKFTLALDNIQDPGNLGTIIRLADWFGIENIICSTNTVELFNPKVIQSTMGAFLRVNVFYGDLKLIFEKIKQSFFIPIYGTFLNGDNIYLSKLSQHGIIIMGNESNGISDSIRPLVTNEITISNFSKKKSKTESLNVSIATAIICSEFKRQQIFN